MTKKIVTKKGLEKNTFVTTKESSKKIIPKIGHNKFLTKNSENENISRQNIVTLIFLTTQVVSTKNKICLQN